MRCEIPIPLRCCFCFPLRYGLLVWAYVKQICSFLFLAQLILTVCTTYWRMDVRGKVWISTIIAITIVDIVLHVFFIISAHTKNYRIMRIFYRYSIGLLCVNMIIMAMYIGSWVVYMLKPSTYETTRRFITSFILPALGMTVILITSQGYLIVLVRSEFIKLKNNTQFEFVNNAAEEQCTANIDFENGPEEY